MTRLAFLGTPAVAASTLRALVAAGHDVALVVTGDDRRRGRGAAPTPNTVKSAALELAIPVTSRVADVSGADVELGVVVAFGKLIKAEVLERVPMVNLHFSLLPRWRGAAPVERAILAGDAETGVSIMALEAGLDTGPVYVREAVEIDDLETADELRNRLGELGTRLLLKGLGDGPGGLGTPVEQVGEPTYAAKLTVEELRIDWAASAAACHRLVRVGRAFTSFRGKRLVVRDARQRPKDPSLEAHGAGAEADREDDGLAARVPGTLVDGAVVTGDGLLELLEVQAEGRKSQSYATWATGARPLPGERLGP